mgnify:CR=1 FL=1
MPDNPLRLKSIHHVEFWVGNAKQSMLFYRAAFGFQLVGLVIAVDGEGAARGLAIRAEGRGLDQSTGP